MNKSLAIFASAALAAGFISTAPAIAAAETTAKSSAGDCQAPAKSTLREMRVAGEYLDGIRNYEAHHEYNNVDIYAWTTGASISTGAMLGGDSYQSDVFTKVDKDSNVYEHRMTATSRWEENSYEEWFGNEYRYNLESLDLLTGDRESTMRDRKGGRVEAERIDKAQNSWNIASVNPLPWGKPVRLASSVEKTVCNDFTTYDLTIKGSKSFPITVDGVVKNDAKVHFYRTLENGVLVATGVTAEVGEDFFYGSSSRLELNVDGGTDAVPSAKRK